MGLQDGAHAVGYPYHAVGKEVPISAYVMSEELLDKDPEIRDRFTEAIERAVELIESDPEVLDEAVKSFSDIDPDILDTMVINEFPVEFVEGSTDRWVELMQTDGLIDDDFDSSGLITPTE